ncbi:MAG TPA: 50S ribosomal protein L2 [Candidatus Paceibacterota bacterium]|nr:50S ribosomal protein L2 [Candidatus Paceibacterota bacterium]
MKSHKPTSPSQRSTLTIDYRTLLTRSTPHKPLTKGVQRAVGRNNQGRITTRHKGGGNKRRYRLVDFLYDKHDVPATITSIEYDPNRSAFIGLALYRDGDKRYVVVPKRMAVGSGFVVSKTAPIEVGNRLPLAAVPAGTFVYNIELKPSQGAKLVRSAGVFAQVVAQNEGYTQLKLPSSEVRRVQDTCWATIGEVSNEERKLVSYGKAGRSRWKGIRPTVRGTAMNPVDHPYGGGEGLQGRGTRRPKTAWGKVTGGRKTRTPKKYSNYNIIARRKTGKK